MGLVCKCFSISPCGRWQHPSTLDQPTVWQFWALFSQPQHLLLRVLTPSSSSSSNSNNNNSSNSSNNNNLLSWPPSPPIRLSLPTPSLQPSTLSTAQRPRWPRTPSSRCRRCPSNPLSQSPSPCQTNSPRLSSAALPPKQVTTMVWDLTASDVVLTS